MSFQSFHAVDIDQFLKIIDQLASDKLVQSAMILATNETSLDDFDFTRLPDPEALTLFGGEFPGIIINGVQYSHGIGVIPIYQKVTPVRVPLNESVSLIESIVMEMTQQTALNPQSAIIFADALSPLKEDLIVTLFNFYGNQIIYNGGCAGNLSFNSKRCVYTNDGAFSYSAIIGFLERRMVTELAHGWESISDPLKITSVSDKVVTELNWRPALEVYLEVIQSYSPDHTFDGDFLHFAKSFPMGIVNLDDEYVIRDPISTDGQHITFIERMYENDHLCVMHGDIDTLLGASESVINKIRLSEKSNPDYRFTADCITRALFMQTDFQKELSILNGSAPINGVLSIGELASDGKSFFKASNKTVAVSSW